MSDEDRKRDREARRKARMEKLQNEEVVPDSNSSARRRRRRDEPEEETSSKIPEVMITEHDGIENNTIVSEEASDAIEELESDVIPQEENKVVEEDDTMCVPNEEDITEEKLVEEINEENIDTPMETEQEDVVENHDEIMPEVVQEVEVVQIEQPEIEPDNKKNRTKRKGLGGLSPEKKKLLRQLIMQKAAEEMKAEAKRRQEVKEQYLKEKVGNIDIDSMNEAQLHSLVKNLHSKINVIEGEKYDYEIKIGVQQYEINAMTIKVNDVKGKFVKPVLKKVSKTEQKLSKLDNVDDKLTLVSFKEQLKSTGLNKYALEDKEEMSSHNKMEWRDNLKTAKEDDEHEKKKEIKVLDEVEHEIILSEETDCETSNIGEDNQEIENMDVEKVEEPIDNESEVTKEDECVADGIEEVNDLQCDPEIVVDEYVEVKEEKTVDEEDHSNETEPLIVED